MDLANAIRVAGTLQLLLAAMNVVLLNRINRRNDLQRLSLLNRQIFQVHYLFIILILTLMGILSLAYADVLLEPRRLARVLLAGLACFWLARLAVQWLVYDRELWRGRRFETSVHIAFTVLWSYFAVVYGMGWWFSLSP